MFDRLNPMFVALGVKMRSLAHELRRRQEGQSFVEYALIITLVAVAVALLTQWGAFTTAIHDSLQKVIDALKAAGA